MLTRRTILAAACSLSAPALASNQNDLTLVVPAAAGGSSDATARILSSHFSMQGTQSSVLNRSAGAGVEGTMYVLRSQSNSGLLLVGGPNGLFLAPARERLPYTANDFDPICMFSVAAFGIAIRSGRESTLAELLDRARTRPIAVGTGESPAHFLIDRLFKSRGSNLIHVPYRGGGDATRDLMAGVIDAVYVSVASFAGLAQSGDVRILAHTMQGGGLIPSFPEVPHVYDALSGERDPTLVSYHYHGLYAPKGMAMNIKANISASVQAACADHKFITDHQIRGMTSRYLGTQELIAYHEEVRKGLVDPYAAWLRRST